MEGRRSMDLLLEMHQNRCARREMAGGGVGAPVEGVRCMVLYWSATGRSHTPTDASDGEAAEPLWRQGENNQRPAVTNMVPCMVRLGSVCWWKGGVA